MEKKVGNYIFNGAFLATLLFSSLYNIASDGAIVLRIHDMNHKPIDQVMCQSPFMLQVEVKNIEGYSQTHLMQYIVGIENFKSSQSMTSHNVFIENGKKITKFLYNFVLRADKKGTFTLGPLVLRDNTGQTIKSNRLIVSVGDEVIAKQGTQKDSYFMTIDVDKKKVYVGEKIRLKVNFYDRLFVDDLHIKFPDFQNLHIVKNKKNYTQQITTIDGVDYKVTEWIFDMYPTNLGPLIIQDIQAAFFTPEPENKYSFGGVFDFFRSLQKTEHYVVGQPVKIEVMPLPQHSKQLLTNATGQFFQYVISINQDTAAAGQGVVLTTELFGDANFEMMQPIDLILPEGCTCYNSGMVTINEDRNSKRSEYIVQAHAPGMYHIAPQIVTYFDPVDGQYKTIKSNALDLLITPGVKDEQTLHIVDNNVDLTTENGEESLIKIKDFHPIQSGSIYACKEKTIPLLWYKFIVFLLCLVWLLLALNKYFLHNFISNHEVWIRYKIFSQAKKSCRIAQKNNEIHAIHGIFVQLFAQLMHKNIGIINQEDIVQYLVVQNFSQEKIEAWKNFNHNVLHNSFSLHNKNNNQKLFVQSFEWIQLLKEKA